MKYKILKSVTGQRDNYKFHTIQDATGSIVEYETEDAEELEDVIIELYKIYPTSGLRVVEEVNLSIDISLDESSTSNRNQGGENGNTSESGSNDGASEGGTE